MNFQAESWLVFKIDGNRPRRNPAVVQVANGMIVGLGSGSTAALAVSALGKRVREAVVIDPGNEIQSISLRVKATIITHAHIDHVGGAQKLKAAIGAPV